MNKYEYMKNINIEQMGHFLCDAMEDSEDDFPCERCPMNGKCTEGINGWVEWLKEEHKK